MGEESHPPAEPPAPPPNQPGRVRLFISGRVQGVWFRESMRQEAGKFNVRGWVRNLPDGRVEAVLEGEAFGVQRLVEWSARGPPRASVRHVERLDEAWTGSFSGFEVQR